MTLRRRVLVMIVLLSLTTLLLGLVSVSSTHERDRLFEQFDTALAQDQALNRVDGCVEDLHRQIGLLFQSGAVLRGPELEPFWSQLEDCEAKTQRLAAIERDGVASAGVTGEVSGLLTSWRQALEQMEKNDLASALTEIVTVADKLAVPLLTGTLPARQQAVRQYVEETRATYQQRSQRADLLTATASLFVFLSILLLLVSLRRLELGVRGLLGASASFTRGDLRHRVGDSGITEIDAVAQQMNLMAVELERARGELELRASELEVSLTSLQEAQESMVVQEKMAALGGLVAGVAHEINTPIGVAVTAVTFARDELDQLREALKENAPDRDELEEAIGALDEAFGLIYTNTRRAGELVASFKQVAVDRSDVKLRKVALGPWIESVRNSLTPLARRQRVALTSGVEAEPSELRLAPGLLEQVLTNLTVNSIIHAFPDTSEVASAANPLVHIALRATPESLSILVSDNGCGMSEEVQKKVFDPFFTTRRGRGGTGLGMHIVHQIVVGQLGGAVDLESAPGSGTRWTIRIPVLDGTLSAVGMEPKVSA